MRRLAGRVAVVSGAASGIGLAIAGLFAREGAAVAVVDRDESGREVARRIETDGGQAIFCLADVTQDAACRDAVQRAAEHLGEPAILVHAAGVIRRADVEGTSEEAWDTVFDVNVKGLFLLSRAALPYLRRTRGCIVSIGSGWGLVGGARAAAYCASKGAVIQLTRAMAIDHGPDGVRVNCVCPGDIDTPMLRQEARELDLDDAAFLQEAADRPLRRVGHPEEVAQAVLYLASDDASFVTGTVLVVDGGGLAG